MKFKFSRTFFLLYLIHSWFALPLFGFEFLHTKAELKPYYGRNDVLMIASPGRSGSTVLKNAIVKYATNYAVIKCHFLPPDARYKGKIIFIFSNPDLAAESALHKTLYDLSFGTMHFLHIESSDHKWLQKIGTTTQQTLEDNLLSYDALGCVHQLKEWLYNKTKPCALRDAQILAIKYEYLWDPNMIEIIKTFLSIPDFALPPFRERGYDKTELTQKELEFREYYNKGTDENPRYTAYNAARRLWKVAPPYQFLKLAP